MRFLNSQIFNKKHFNQLNIYYEELSSDKLYPCKVCFFIIYDKSEYEILRNLKNNFNIFLKKNSSYNLIKIEEQLIVNRNSKIDFQKHLKKDSRQPWGIVMIAEFTNNKFYVFDIPSNSPPLYINREKGICFLKDRNKI